MKFNTKQSFYLFLLLSGISILYSATPTTSSTTLLQPQPDLTDEELSIIEQMQLVEQSSDLDYKNDIERHLSKIEKSMNEKISNLEKYNNYDLRKAENDLIPLLDRFYRIKNVTEDLFLHDIYEFNKRELIKILERITQVVNDELERRGKEPDVVYASDEEEDDEDDEDDDNDEEQSNQEKVTKEYLAQTISLDSLLDHSESILIEAASQRISDFIDTEVLSPALAKFDDDLKEKNNEFNKAHNMLQKEISIAREKAKVGEDRRCLHIVDAFNLVQTSLWKYKNDGGLYDHLSDNAAVVVYGEEWTSSTYRIQSSSKENGESTTLGDYEHFMPEDWERLLPSGWKNINISSITNFFKNPSKYIPTAFWHSFPLPVKNLLSPKGGSIVSKPPETIMNKNNHLGSCWAMAGSNGKVTLRLRNPISINSVTIDHYPGLQTAHDTSNYKGYSRNNSAPRFVQVLQSINTSAPRFVRVVGYPLCDDENKDTIDCIKLGFDKSKPINLGSFEYERVPSIADNGSQNQHQASRSSQTFTLKASHNTGDSCGSPESSSCGGSYDDGYDSEGSCGSSYPSCGHEGDEEDHSDVERPIVAAVSFVIDGNWGNENYTCLYRVRVHTSSE